MSDVVVRSPLQYLDRATNALRDLGLRPGRAEDAPVNALPRKVSQLDEDRISCIARTVAQASVCNDGVRRQTEAVEIGQCYQDIARAFDSIRDDAKKMVDQLDDGSIDF